METNGYCTILGPTVDYPGIVSELARLSGGNMDISGDVNYWTSIVITNDDKKLTFNSQQWTAPGDDFSTMIISMYNYFRRMESESPETRRAVLEKVSNSRIAIGVVPLPLMLEETTYIEMILTVARKVNGFIFNGYGMLDDNGEILMDPDGTSETGT